jgi:hypothetical protein
MDRFNLGSYRRIVTTQSAEAPHWFDKHGPVNAPFGLLTRLAPDNTRLFFT